VQITGLRIRGSIWLSSTSSRFILDFFLCPATLRFRPRCGWREFNGEANVRVAFAVGWPCRRGSGNSGAKERCGGGLNLLLHPLVVQTSDSGSEFRRHLGFGPCYELQKVSPCRCAPLPSYPISQEFLDPSICLKTFFVGLLLLYSFSLANTVCFELYHSMPVWNIRDVITLKSYEKLKHRKC
jgi:hypothetical protein